MHNQYKSHRTKAENWLFNTERKIERLKKRIAELEIELRMREGANKNLNAELADTKRKKALWSARFHAFNRGVRYTLEDMKNG